ncbi:MAG: hypothetical protein LH603_01030 [Pseudonocardia sp.]|nr:hypothetical protein [Pseudonocardia sp.]
MTALGAAATVFERSPVSAADFTANRRALLTQSMLFLSSAAAGRPAGGSRRPSSPPGQSAARRLRRAGHRLVARPETFRVTGTQGPLLDGEQARAHRWGEAPAAELTGAAPARPSRP